MKGAGCGSAIDKRVIAGFHCFQATKFGTGSYRPLTSHCLYVPVIGQYIGQNIPYWLVEIPGFAAECIPHQNIKIRSWTHAYEIGVDVVGGVAVKTLSLLSFQLKVVYNDNGFTTVTAHHVDVLRCERENPAFIYCNKEISAKT